jgi:hypothetical protein
MPTSHVREHMRHRIEAGRLFYVGTGHKARALAS